MPDETMGWRISWVKAKSERVLNSCKAKSSGNRLIILQSDEKSLLSRSQLLNLTEQFSHFDREIKFKGSGLLSVFSDDVDFALLYVEVVSLARINIISKIRSPKKIKGINKTQQSLPKTEMTKKVTGQTASLSLKSTSISC